MRVIHACVCVCSYVWLCMSLNAVIGGTDMCGYSVLVCVREILVFVE